MKSAVKDLAYSRASGSRPWLALGAFAAMALAWGAQPAHAAYVFQNIIDPANPTFTQALGINTAGTIVGYGNMTVFQRFSAGPVLLPFTRENFPGATGRHSGDWHHAAGAHRRDSTSTPDGSNHGFVEADRRCVYDRRPTGLGVQPAAWDQSERQRSRRLFIIHRPCRHDRQQALSVTSAVRYYTSLDAPTWSRVWAEFQQPGDRS